MGNIFHLPAALVQSPGQVSEKDQIAGPLGRQAAHQVDVGGAGGGVELVHHGADVLFHAAVTGALTGDGRGVGLLQQGVGVLMEDHPLLILDEPTAAMDVAAALRSEEILRGYQARTGCTVVLVTHSMTQARRMAGQVLFLKDGHLVEKGETEQVLSYPRCADTQAFLDFYTL